MPSEKIGSQLSHYQTFWQHKPWWCQPWSILSTGAAGMGAAFLAYRHLHAPLWLVAPFLMAILFWWYVFLVLVPNQDASTKA
ncbi:MAG: DUF6737 family protein [Cyanobium sp.]